jgi:glutamate dehydrogenase
MQSYLQNNFKNNLICENPSYRKSIIEKSIKLNDDKLFAEFVRKFYFYLPVDYMESESAERFAEIANEAFGFSKSRKKDEIKIEFCKRKSSKWGSVLKIVSNDNPFIVDSIKYLLKIRNIHSKIFLHPIIHIERKSDGSIADICSKKGRNESVLYLIIETMNDQMQKEFKAECLECIKNIEIASNAKDKILDKMQLLSKNGKYSKENQAFLKWISDDNFTFLACLDYDTKGKLSNKLGDYSAFEDDITYIGDIIRKAVAKDDRELLIGKMSEITPINSGKNIDYILLKNGDKGTIFFGFYISILQVQSVRSIPILSDKLEYVLDRSGFTDESYNYVKLITIVENFPRDVLFQIAEEDLYCMCLHVLSAMTARTLKLFIEKDNSGEFLNTLIFMPIDRLTPETHFEMTEYLISKFNTKIISDEITDVSGGFCFLYLSLEISNTVEELNLVEIEDTLDQISQEWDEGFYEEVLNQDSDLEHSLNANIFPKEYQYKFSPAEGAIDSTYISRLDDKTKLLFNLQEPVDGLYAIKIYSSEKIILSDTLPLIENLGFKAISEQVYNISTNENTYYLCKFNLEPKAEIEFPFEEIKTNVEDALHYLSVGDFENDVLCNLVVISGLKWHQVNILKAITAFLAQTSFTYDKEYVKNTLVKHCDYSELLIKLFESKFFPDPTEHKNILSLSRDLDTYLNEVKDNVEDKILRAIHSIIQAITRTNCYKSKNKNEQQKYLSFKIDSSKVPNLPKPIPFAEIFVYSNSFEACHLRGGKVARGGLRWSDRKEDYRTEALGLMKAQMTKNAVIVPEGSKGAFFVKVAKEGYEKEEYMKIVIECYKSFLRGMLDVTDNIIDGEVVRPDRVVAYDEDDTYIVAAADKGTATFSDYANAISKEYNFWLGDAFASGGSAGYDHKKMGITSKGAWIAVKRHFAEMGVDVQTDPFTVVGIGDMAGDVFGNGMLRSESTKLVVAFNHMHIFIDPEPDSAISYQERKRLFEMPGSKWSDYNQELLSEGGGIYERSSKKIVISDKAKELLGSERNEFTPENLINTILKAPVDLIWNGGIGTYVKASAESHLSVGDKANDNLRCNGEELRAKVIGEGGNLGFTQLGRIEYAKAGGRINADFIDNSAGVTCSDHEVNIKIALNNAVKAGKLSLDERNNLLEHMTSEVESLVLNNNIKQTAALTITQFSPAFSVGMFQNLMQTLEKEKLLDRKVEFIPNDEELQSMSSAGQMITRPTLSVLMSYSKMSIYNELKDSAIPDDPGSDLLLLNYFPPMMRERFKEEILNHPLKKEIIITSLANKVINELGSPLISHIRSELGAKLCDIIRAYVVVSQIFDIDSFWKEADSLSGKIPIETQIDIVSELIRVLRRGISWFINHSDNAIEIANALDAYGASVKELCPRLGDFLLGPSKEKLESKVAEYRENNVPAKFAESVAILESGISALDILRVSNKNGVDKERVGSLYFKVADYFQIDWMRRAAEKHITGSYWNRMSIQSLKDDLYDKQLRILSKVLQENPEATNLDSWAESNEKDVSTYMYFINKIKQTSTVELNMLIIANKQFEMMLRKV